MGFLGDRQCRARAGLKKSELGPFCGAYLEDPN